MLKPLGERLWFRVCRNLQTPLYSNDQTEHDQWQDKTTRCVLTSHQRRTQHHLRNSPPKMFELNPSMRPTQAEGTFCKPTGLDSPKMPVSWKIFKKLADCFTLNKTKETWEPNATSDSETDPDSGKKAKQIYEGHYRDHWGNLKINRVI